MASECGLGLLGAIVCLWAADSLGKMLLSAKVLTGLNSTSRASVLSLATGWMVLGLWGWGLAAMQLWQPIGLQLTIMSLCGLSFFRQRRQIINKLWHGRFGITNYRTWRANLNQFLEKLAQQISPLWKGCAIVALLLVIVRCLRGFLPLENWDSVNQHLPILIERLQLGQLEPMLNVATDRRIFLGGLFLKGYPMAFNLSGRALVLTHLGLVLMGIWRCAQQLKVWMPERKDLPQLWIFMCLALSNLWIYIGMAGDEPWFFLLALVWIEMLIRPKAYRTNRYLALLASLQMMALSIKATAVFFLCPLGIVGLFLYRRQWKGLIFGSLLGMVVFAATANWCTNNYNMIYPLQRWSNLLATQTPTPMFSSQEVAKARVTLGLADHRDNHGALDAPLAKIFDNLSRWPQLPLGPFWLWAGILLLGSRSWSWRSQESRTAMVLLGMTLLGLGFAMASWSFSSQALTRYLLPLWAWLIMSLAMLCAQHPHYSHWLRRMLLLLLLFALLLEAKALVGLAKASPWWDARATWEQKLVDGPLLKRWRQLNVQGEKTFYLGGASVLLAGQGHWLAQIGNEVGWRDPEDLAEFLRKTQIKWWVLANSAERFDPIYAVLTQKAVMGGWLSLVEECPSGKIYRVKCPSH